LNAFNQRCGCPKRNPEALLEGLQDIVRIHKFQVGGVGGTLAKL